MYLLDANVLIDANRDYYQMERVPEFWDWLVHQGQEGNVKIPLEIYEEIKDGNDDLSEWAKEPDVEAALLLDEDADPDLVAEATDEGYAQDLSEDEVEKLGRDPFLLAYALEDTSERTVVTTEVSKPSRQRASRHLPDVCGDLDIDCCDTFTFVRELDFTTSWDE